MHLHILCPTLSYSKYLLTIFLSWKSTYIPSQDLKTRNNICRVVFHKSCMLFSSSWMVLPYLILHLKRSSIILFVGFTAWPCYAIMLLKSVRKIGLGPLQKRLGPDCWLTHYYNKPDTYLFTYLLIQTNLAMYSKPIGNNWTRSVRKSKIGLGFFNSDFRWMEYCCL